MKAIRAILRLPSASGTTTHEPQYRTYEEARTALETAVHDVEADLGKDAVDQGWRDLVMGIAADCTPDVADELIRRNL